MAEKVAKKIEFPNSTIGSLSRSVRKLYQVPQTGFSSQGATGLHARRIDSGGFRPEHIIDVYCK